jgi:glycyl-tRNA synthetase beta chain
MGRHYAERGGENPCVAAAIEEHYLPRKAGDRLPSTPCGVALAIADRLDTLVGIFAIGQRPTGIKDPYALRRAALGVLRILIETPISLDLRDLLELAALCLREKLDAHEAAEAVLAYMIERLRGYYEEKSIPADVVEAVLARNVSDPSDIDARVRAVHAFRGLPESASLAAANKRIRNILRRSTDRLPTNVSLSVLREPTERHLAQRVQSLEEQVAPLLSAKKYAETLGALTSLKEPVDAFFDDVMVMVDDAELRRNRLALLRSVECLFLQVADLSRLQ